MMHDIMLFTWGSVLLISALGYFVREKKNFPALLASSIGSAIIFFIITNFGAWLSMYPHNLAGLLDCYLAAVPFFRSTLASTLGYSVVFFGIYEAGAGSEAGYDISHLHPLPDP